MESGNAECNFYDVEYLTESTEDAFNKSSWEHIQSRYEEFGYYKCDFEDDITDLPIIEKYQLNTWYRFDKDIGYAIEDFWEKYYDEPNIIAVNKFTYSQLCYIVSISLDRETGEIEKDAVVTFDSIVVFNKPNRFSKSLEVNFCGGCQLWIGRNACEFSSVLNVTYNEGLNDMEFELILVDDDEDDDDEDDFDDDIPDLPTGELVRKRELISV